MTQIAIVQPAAPPPPPAGPPVNSDKEQFSSHFEKAISSKKEERNTQESRTGNQPQKAQDKMPSEPSEIASKDTSATASSQEDTPGEVSGSETDKEAADQDLGDAGSSRNPPVERLIFTFTTTPETTVRSASSSAKAAFPLVGILAQQLNSSAAHRTAENSDSAKNPAVPATPATPAIPAIPASPGTNQTQAVPAVPAVPASPQTHAKPATDALLAQLQDIISNGDEKGTVTISKVNTTPASRTDGSGFQMVLPLNTNSSSQIHVAISSEYSELQTQSQLILPEGFKLPAEKSDNQLTSLRQNTQQQYFEAKLNLQTDGKEGSPSQEQQHKGDPATAATPAVGQNSTAATVTADQPNTFSQVLTTAQNSPSLPATEPAKTITLPSGYIVPEEDVMRQIVERFQFSRRSAETQMNIKLHPAELGELKIDISVKEGSIRANVVAQSQHAQEIIEKNMVRLRTVLESQGFSIDSITVSSKFDSTQDSSHFDRQLFSQNDYSPNTGKQRNSSQTAFRLEEVFTPNQPASTGVNVKI